MSSVSAAARARTWTPAAARCSPAAWALVIAAVLSAVWAALPPVGSDLAAQVEHADFFSRAGWLPVDMRWFGGVDVLGYSLISPALMSVLGITAFGVLATVAASWLLGLLLARTAVPHPRAAAAVGAVCLSANLMVGRLTFALGVCLALATLLCLGLQRRFRLPLLVVGTLATWAASPLAALFLAMVGVAMAVRRRLADGAALALTGGVVMLASSAIGQGGVMPMSGQDLARGLLACAIVAVVTRSPLVRVTAALSAASLLFAYAVATPVGVNAMRFAGLFGVPVAVATSRLRWRAAVPLLAVVLLLAPPMTLGDAVVGRPADSPSYFAPLVAELGRLPLSGRVEVVPTVNRWESVYVARSVPLARGWMTQLDRQDDPLFFEPALMTPGRYRSWLRSNAVQYVALSDAAPAASGVTERRLIRGGLPYLSRAWSGRNWSVYAVSNPTSTVEGAALLRQDAASVAFRAASARPVLVRVQWSRWLALRGDGACLRQRGRWTEVVVRRPGRYLLTSALLPGDQHRTCAAPTPRP